MSQKLRFNPLFLSGSLFKRLTIIVIRNLFRHKDNIFKVMVVQKENFLFVKVKMWKSDIDSGFIIKQIPSYNSFSGFQLT